MKLKDKEIVLNGAEGPITIKRNRHGIPEIAGESLSDLAYGLGWVHANDRMLHIMLTRIILQGRASEILADEEPLVELDRYMRRIVHIPDIDKEIKKLKPSAHKQLEQYSRGINDFLASNKNIFEFKLLKYKPEKWALKDSIILAKYFAFFGLIDAQAGMEKLLIQMIQNDIDKKKIKELFPYLKEKIDYNLIKKITLSPPLAPESIKWLDTIPKLRASNNWAVSGKLTVSGKPILCGDPHLEVNRVPSIWYETVMRLPDNNFVGVTIPGIPGLILGRNNHISWSATYSFMDMIDFRIEQCKNGKYKRSRKWLPFKVRNEIIKTKKGSVIEEKIYETEQGILEGNPDIEGYYLSMCWSGQKETGAGEFNGLLGVMNSSSVKEAMENFRLLDAATFNWVIADSSGNIGYQMSGRLYRRPAGVSGLLPLPAWEKKYDSRGYTDKNKLPRLYNPKDGIIVTANQDLNHLGRTKPINLPMASYRADRILDLLKNNKKLSVEDMKKIHYDLYSIQAEKFMDIIKPHIPPVKRGEILSKWDLRYSKDSTGATIFENIYMAILKNVFGDNGMGREAVNYLMTETPVFNDYFGNFDNIIFNKKSGWFKNKNRDAVIKEAVEEGLEGEALPYGLTRNITLSHLLFGGKLPSFAGFDIGPISLPGSRSTVLQGQIFKSAGRVTTFSPSYRFIADMSTGSIHSNIAGGSSDRRFSGWYKTDLKNWLNGIYKILE